MALGQRFTSVNDGTSTSGSFATKPSAGHCVVVCISGRAFTGEFSVSAISDSASNTYVKRGEKRTTGLAVASEIWVAENVAVPGGTWTITATHTNGSCVLSAASFDNVATSNSFDKVATASTVNSATLTVGPTATLSQANELIVGCWATYIASANVGVTTPSGYSEIGVYQDAGSFVGHQSCYKDVSATTAASATWTTSTPTYYSADAVLVTLKTTGAGGGGTTTTISGSDTLPTASAGTSVPGAPTLSTAVVTSSRGIRATWTAASGTVDGYRIYGTVGGVRSVIGTAGAGALTLEAVGLLPNTTYSVDVVAFNGAGEGPASNALSRTTLKLKVRISKVQKTIAGVTDLRVIAWRQPLVQTEKLGDKICDVAGISAPAAIADGAEGDSVVTITATLTSEAGALVTTGQTVLAMVLKDSAGLSTGIRSATVIEEA